jgi:hypothetical protein
LQQSERANARGISDIQPTGLVLRGVSSGPAVVDWPGAVIAINVAGALIPGAMSYFWIKYRLWVPGIVATIIVAGIGHVMRLPPNRGKSASPKRSSSLRLGRVRRTDLVLAARRAGCLLYRRQFGHADWCRSAQSWQDPVSGAPVASIGGAAMFDGTFLIGSAAVLFTNISRPQRSAEDAPRHPTQVTDTQFFCGRRRWLGRLADSAPPATSHHEGEMRFQPSQASDPKITAHATWSKTRILLPPSSAQQQLTTPETKATLFIIDSRYLIASTNPAPATGSE